MTPSQPDQENTQDAATAAQHGEELPEKTPAGTELPAPAGTEPPAPAGTEPPAPAGPDKEEARAQPSLAEADPLLSLLRSGLLPPEPSVSGKHSAKAQKAQLKKEQLENARLEKAKSERAQAERADFEREQAEKAKNEKAQLEAARLENAEYEKAKSARAKLEKAKAEKTQAESATAENAGSETPPIVDSLLSLLRGGTLPPAPVVSGKHDAKAGKARLEQDRLEQAKLAEAELETARAETAQAEIVPTEETQSTEEAPGKPPLPDAPAHSGRRGMGAVAEAILVLACVAGVLFLFRDSLFRAPLLGPGDRLMVAAIENRTGDQRLDGAVAQGLQFELQESPYLAFRGRDAFRSCALQLVDTADRPPSPVLARQAAQAAGAKAYLYGTLRAAGAAYILTVDILDAVDNRKLLELRETAASRQQIPQAIERIAATLRFKLVTDTGSHPGKGGDSPLRSDVPLSRDASANLDALHDYSLGEAAQLDGRTDDALAAFRSAAADDPKFIQAQMQLAWLYRRQHAQPASAAAARLAEQAATAASPRTMLLARYTFEVNATGDLLQADAAIRRFIALYPHDPQGALGLARLLLLQNRPAEALDAAQRGLADDPYDAELYQQAELALVLLGRAGDAQALQQKSQGLRVEPAAAAQ